MVNTGWLTSYGKYDMTGMSCGKYGMTWTYGKYGMTGTYGKYRMIWTCGKYGITQGFS